MRRIAISVVASGVLFAGMAASALAASPSQEDCEAAGGSFDRTNGEVSCTFEEHVGNSENSQTVTDETTDQGNIGNKQQSDCDGTGNSGPGTDHCP